MKNSFLVLVFLSLIYPLAQAADEVDCEIVCSNASGRIFKYWLREGILPQKESELLKEACGRTSTNEGSKIVCSPSTSPNAPSKLLDSDVCKDLKSSKKNAAPAARQ